MRGTWASHGVKGWYLGPLMNHYLCHHIVATTKKEENETQIVLSFSHIILHSPTSLPLKIPSSRRVNYPTPLKNPVPQAPFSNIGDSQIFAIEQLSNIFTKAADNVKSTEDPPQHQTEQKSAIIPQKLHPGWTKNIPSVQPNLNEYEEGKEPTNY